MGNLVITYQTGEKTFGMDTALIVPHPIWKAGYTIRLSALPNPQHRRPNPPVLRVGLQVDQLVEQRRCRDVRVLGVVRTPIGNPETHQMKCR